MSSTIATEFACRSCGDTETHTFYRGESVPVHSFRLLDTRDEAQSLPRGEVELALCTKCGLIQNTRFDAEVREHSSHYQETRSFSPRFHQFARELAEDYRDRFDLRGKTVLQTGSGDSGFLVDLGEVAEQVPFDVNSFSDRYHDAPADLVLCRHALECIESPREFVRMVHTTVRDRDGVVLSFQLPDTERILEQHAFWDIHYERCSYFTDDSLRHLFESNGFETLDQRRWFDGQYWIHDATPGPSSQPSVDDVKWRDAVGRFEHRVLDKIQDWRRCLASACSRGERVALWGSGSKAVSFMTALCVEDEVAAVTDVNPHRHGKFLPGTGHQIVPPSELMNIRPDIVVAMNPVYLDEIRDDLRAMGLDSELTAL